MRPGYRAVVAASLAGSVAALCHTDPTLAQTPVHSASAPTISAAETAKAHFDRGTALMKSRNREGAEAEFNKAIALKKDYGEAYNQRGMCHGMLHEYQEAARDHSRALKLVKNNPLIYRNLCLDHYLLSDSESALPYCNKAVDLKPDDSFTICLRGAVLGFLGKEQQALADENRGIALDRRSIYCLDHRAETYVNLNIPRKAVEDCRSALAPNPNDSVALLWRGTAYGMLGVYDEALNNLDWAITISPDDATLYMTRAAA